MNATQQLITKVETNWRFAHRRRSCSFLNHCGQLKQRERKLKSSFQPCDDCNLNLGDLQSKTIPKILVNYGSRWVGPGLTRKQCIGKSSQNSQIPILIFWSSIQCVFCLYTLLKVVSYYDLSVLLSMSVMVSKKNVWIGRWVGWALSRFILDFWNFVTLQNPLGITEVTRRALRHIDTYEDDVFLASVPKEAV